VERKRMLSGFFLSSNSSYLTQNSSAVAKRLSKMRFGKLFKKTLHY